MANHDDILTNKQRIESKIQELEMHREALFNAATKKAQTLSDYRKTKAITILKLRNKQIEKFEGVNILYPLQTTIMDSVASGICFKEVLERYEADALYKGLITVMESLKAELNGLQSINRHLE